MMESLSIDLTSLDEKDDQQMIALVQPSDLEDDAADLNDNSDQLVHHVLEPAESTLFGSTSECSDTKLLGVPKCLVCNAKMSVSGRGAMDIFSKEVKTSCRGLDLDLMLTAITSQDISSSAVHSSMICKKCFKLVDDIDTMEEQLVLMKQEVTSKLLQTRTLINQQGIDDATPSIEAVTEYEEGLITNSSEDRDFKLYANSSKARKRGRKSRGRGRPPPFIKLEVKEESEDVMGQFTLDSNSLPMQEKYISDGDDTLSDDQPSFSNEEPITTEKVEVEDFIEVDGLDICNLEDRPIQIGGEVISLVNEISTLQSPLGDGNLTGDASVKYKCRFCDVRLVNFFEMKKHLCELHTDRLYECEVCNESQGSQEGFLDHISQHLSSIERPFCCDICSTAFSLPRQLKHHIRQQHPKIWCCYQCEKKFISSPELQEHLTSHFVEYRPHPCDKCGKRFSSKQGLRNHSKTHGVRSRPHRCRVCSKDFLTSYHLQDHALIHRARKEFICDTCGKAFTTQRSLDLHAIVHTGIKNYVCRVCNKAFARKGEVEDHERIHSGERPFQCEFCGATFCQRSNLQSHKKATHFEEKKYRCSDCPKAFKRRRLLVYHVMSVHTGERPYKCTFCSAAFVYPEHYKKHLRIHSGIKPFKCEICSKAFSSRDNKNAHKFIHSEKKQYECMLCGSGFMRKPLLIAHLQQHGRSDNYDAYIKVNSSSVVDDEISALGLNRTVGSPGLMKIDEDRSMESSLEAQMIHTGLEGGESSSDAIARQIHIMGSEDLPRYIIHTPEGRSDESVGHFLASLQGQVVEVRTEDLGRYAELTADQINQMAHVAAQVVSTSPTEDENSQEIEPEFRSFQLEIDDKAFKGATIITASEEEANSMESSDQSQVFAPSAQFRKTVSNSLVDQRQIRSWHQVSHFSDDA